MHGSPGTTPTASLGFLYRDGATARWTPKMLAGAKGIRTAGTSVVVEMQELNSI